MKRILLLLCAVVALVLFGSANVYAQSKKPPMFYKTGKFTVGYDVIDKAEYRNYFTPEEFQRVNAAFNMRKAGIGVMAGGAGLCVAASILMGVGEKYMEEDYRRTREADTNGMEYDGELFDKGNALFWSGFGVMMAGGGLTLGAGVPLFCVAESRLKKAAQGYNERNHITLSVNLGQYGPGLALKF